MSEKLSREEMALKISHLEKANANLNKQVQSNIYIKALLETTDDAIMVTDENGVPRFFNSAYANSLKDALGIEMKPGVLPNSFMNDPDSASYWQSLKERALNGERFRVEYKHDYKDSRRRYFEFSYCPIRVDQKVTGFTQIARDITDRVLAQEALKEKEKLLGHAEKIAGIGSFIWNLKTNQVVWSENLFRIHGIPEKDVPQKPLKIDPDMVHPEDREKALNQISEMITARKISPIEFRIIPSDGMERKIRWNGELENDETGNPVKFYGVYQNITEASKAKDELAERNVFIETVLDKMPIGIAVTRLSTGVSSLINEKFEEVYGWPKEEIPDLRSFFKKTHPEPKSRETIRQRMVDDVMSGDVSRMKWADIEIATKTGEKRIVSSITIPLFEQDVIISTVMDATERHQMIASLKESEERYKALFDRSFDCVCIYDIESNFIDGNKAFFDLLEYSKQEISKASPLLMIAPGSRKEYIKARTSLLEKGFEEHVSEYQILTKSGVSKTVEMRRSLILRNETPYAIQNFFRDISHEKYLEEQVRHAQKMESIGTLARGIAHDFNNILGIILGNTELSLQEIPEKYSSRGFLAEIQTACLRGTDVVKQLLGFSLKTEDNLIHTDLLTILQGSLMTLKQKARPGIEILSSFPAICPVILADEAQIHQLLMILFDNALEAIKDRGRIEIIADRISSKDLPETLVPDLPSANYLRITVKDTGSGIDPDTLNRIFDPYFTTKTIGKGSGMGLSIAHGIIKSHNGTIRIESTIGKGTALSLFFPEIPRLAIPNEVTEKNPPGGNERILFVDDEDSLLTIGQIFLERLGYVVETRQDPVEALKIFRSQPDKYDLVITDLSMPNITGDDLANEILSVRPDLPIILCTGFAGRTDDPETKDTGISAILAKPFTYTGLASCVRKVLNKK